MAKKEAAKTPAYQFFLNQANLPRALFPDRRLDAEEAVLEQKKQEADKAQAAEDAVIAERKRHGRPYMLPCWVEEYSQRVEIVVAAHPRYETKQIEDEIQERMDRKLDPRILGLPAGDPPGRGLIKKARRATAKAVKHGVQRAR